MPARPNTLAAAAALLALTACDVPKTVSQVQATAVIMGTVLHTPEIQVDLLAVSGLDAGAWLADAGITLPDGGFDLDGGLPDWDGGYDLDAGIPGWDGGIPGLEDAGVKISLDGKVTFPAQTLAGVLFAKRKGTGLDATNVEPVADADLMVQPAGTAPLASLTGNDAGVYSLSSMEEPAFGYVEGADYRITAQWNGQAYVAAMQKAPQVERIPQFHPDGGTVMLHVGGELTFTRPEPPQDEPRNFGLVTVFPISNSGERGGPTYSTAPTDPGGILALVTTPARWRASPVTIPASAFPEPNTTYVVLFQSVKLGGAESSNVFLGSALLVGTADVAVVRTLP